MLIIKRSEKLLKDGKVYYYFMIDRKETSKKNPNRENIRQWIRIFVKEISSSFWVLSVDENKYSWELIERIWSVKNALKYWGKSYILEINLDKI